MSGADRPWNVPVNVDEVPETGGHYELDADQSVRDAVARVAGLRGVSKLEAVFDLAPRAAGVAVKGEVRARVGQTCVITLEPIENEVHETVDLVFARSAESATVRKRDEPVELLEDGIIDLGAVTTEFLMLGLDPYPRKPGAEFLSVSGKQGGESPFAALAALKRRS